MNKVRATVWMAAVTAAAAALMTALPWAMRAAQPTERAVQVRLCRVEAGRVEQVLSLIHILTLPTTAGV